MSDVAATRSGDASEREQRPGHRRHHRHLTALEWLTLVHVGVFVIAATWAFGGQADYVRPALTAWGAAGMLIPLAAVLNENRGASDRRALWWLIPIGLFNAVVLAAALNPSFRAVHAGVDTVLVNDIGRPLLPSSARPQLARSALWTFDAIWIACFNVALVFRHRRAVRILLIVTAANAVVLAIFGTVQNLLHAPGLFFGAVPSPQTYFFASFVYHNHWGAFGLLMIALSIGLCWHYFRRRQARDFFHSPVFMGCVGILLLAVTLPLSTSRSSTVLGGILLATACAHSLVQLIRTRRRYRESILVPVIGTSVALLVGAAAVGYLARDTIARRFDLTRRQVTASRAAPGRDARVQLYRDTWHMAADKPWFGWGMASYPYVFTLYNRRESVDRLPVFYHDAHSDWLQALAEHGIVGTLLLTATAVLPLLQLSRRSFETPLAAYLLGGCGLVVGYAAFEFPFGNFAVVLCWWLCFFCAVQYGRLTAARDRGDDAPARNPAT